MKNKITLVTFTLLFMLMGSGLKAQQNAFFYIDANDCKKVHFYDSIFAFRPTQYSWNFGDGNTSTNAYPSHTYAANGTYNVTLYAYDSVSTNSVNDTISLVINCGPCTTFKANAWSYTDQNNCKKIRFVNTSSTGTYSWNFGDGNSSTLKSPIHTYATDGIYTVNLFVSDSLCADSINLTAKVNCTTNKCDSFFARAIYTIDSVDCKKIHFTNLSSAGNYSWNFGDGNTSTSTNPTHTYAVKGTYGVFLDVWDSLCADSMIVAVDANCTPPDPCKGFNAIIDLWVDSSNTSKALLYNRSTGNVNAHSWDFGDGTTSTLSAPTHTYTTPGSVTLTYIASDTFYNCSDTAIITFTIDSLGNIRRGDIKMVLNIIDLTQNASTIGKVPNSNSTFEVYPNPIANQFSLKANTASLVSIYNLQGKNISTVNLMANEAKTVNCSAWTSGVYLIVSDQLGMHKIVKE